ncbi:MAG: class I SAM-dependent methyltransferase [Candidatus Paceibacterota bacterium]|jgi:SAM-dependent methyltransferase
MKKELYSQIFENEMSHWWYRVRRKMIKDLLFLYEMRGRNTKILDIGCGTGALLGEMEPFGDVYGVDFSPEAVQFCKRRGFNKVEEGSILKIPFPDGSFDFVLALDILEHIENDEVAIMEICRVLKEGGIFIFFVPAFRFLWGETDVLGEHKRRYRRPELLEKIRKNGELSVLRSSYFNTFLFFPIATARFAANLFRLGQKLESNPGNGFANKILYGIFYTESILLRFMNFPFGVSIFVVGTKKDKKIK